MDTQISKQKIEFMGYLKGEGCFRLSKKEAMSRRRGWKESIMYTPVLVVAARDDDADILKWAKDTYGGSIYHRSKPNPSSPNQKPHYIWQVTSAKVLVPILEDFVDSSLPSKKTEQAKILLDICNLKVNVKRQATGRTWYSEEDRKLQDDAFYKLKELKQYK